MVKNVLIIIIPILFLLNINSFGQTIHKDDVYDFKGILITAPHQKPNKWPDGKPFEKYHVLEDTFYFHTTDSDPPSNIFFQPFPDWHDSISIKTTVFVPPHIKKGFQLEIPEKEWRLIMFNNGGYESSTNYLTLWKVEGDSLIFQKLFSEPIRTGAQGFNPQYKINRSDDLIFTYEGGFGDAGTLIRTYFFLHLDKDQNLNLLLDRKTRSNYNKGGKREVLLHKFLDDRMLLIQVSTFDIIQHEDVNQRGFKYIFYDYELDDIKSEIVNFEKLLPAQTTKRVDGREQ